MTCREPRRPYGASWSSGPRPPAASSLWSWSFGPQGRIHEILPFAERYVDLEPNASGPRLLELRVYTELDDRSGLEDAAEDWMDGGGPYSPPYREVARVYGRVFGPERALSILERGRSALGRPSLFAMEAGDFLKDLGRMEEAGVEWAGVIGNDGSQVSALMRRVAEFEEDREKLVLALLEQLRQPPTTWASAPGWGPNRLRGRSICGGEVPG